MNTHSVLDTTLKDILDGIKPLQQDWEIRFKIIEELRDVVKPVESLRGATVEPFGSFVSNLFTRWGDLDISLLLANGAYISSSGKKRKQILLEDVLRALRLKDGWHRFKFIPNARIPVLKFETVHGNISCDISIDNLQGLMKSKFLFWLNEIDKRFRDMVLLVKEWAKAHNINSPMTGSLNSYSLSLLVIFHFQTCAPPIFPPLKEIYPRNAVDDLTGVRSDAERYIGEICAANISKYRSDKFRAVNRSTLSELFISFLAKFSDISLRAKKLGICPFTGRWEEIRSNMRWLPRTYAIFIEDPFEQPENTARAVSAGNLQRISEAFQTTYNGLASANQNQNFLLGILVRPHITRCIPGMSLSRTAGPHVTAYPQICKSLYPPSQAQSRIHYTRREDHNYRPVVQRKDSHPSKSTKQRKEGYQGNSTKQRKESYQGNSTKQRLESPTSNLTKLRQETHASNSTEVRQESCIGNSVKEGPGKQYYNQGQKMWRPKSSK